MTKARWRAATAARLPFDDSPQYLCRSQKMRLPCPLCTHLRPYNLRDVDGPRAAGDAARSMHTTGSRRRDASHRRESGGRASRMRCTPPDGERPGTSLATGHERPLPNAWPPTSCSCVSCDIQLLAGLTRCHRVIDRFTKTPRIVGNGERAEVAAAPLGQHRGGLQIALA